VTPTPRELFVGFLVLSLKSIGGALPWARRELVDRRRWMTNTEFVDLLSLGQIFPGGNILNVGVLFGGRVRGAPGAAGAALGFIAVPALVIGGIGALYWGFGSDLTPLRGATLGMAVVAAALLIATAVRLALPVVRRRPAHALPIALGALAAVGLVGLPMPLVLAVLAPISVSLALRDS